LRGQAKDVIFGVKLEEFFIFLKLCLETVKDSQFQIISRHHIDATRIKRLQDPPDFLRFVFVENSRTKIRTEARNVLFVTGLAEHEIAGSGEPRAKS
jgi:hypothetical protein